MRLCKIFVLLYAWLVGSYANTAEEMCIYGLDCSFPVQSKDFSCGDLLGDRQKAYNAYIQGCRDFYGRKGYLCDEYEKSRIKMNVRQPQSMVNYTSTGFMKIQAPEAIRKLLDDHWKKNGNKRTLERWPEGDIYINHWQSPTYIVNVEDNKLRGARLKQAFWDAAKETVEQWTKMEQKPTSLYGIRVYTEGAEWAPHVDRIPLISSALVNVAQDVDEPWPLEVYDREGNAVNVTMEPGDMLLYESASLVHGRPFPLKGRYYADIFIHFEPTGRPLSISRYDWVDTLDDFLPPYLLPDSPQIDHWIQQHPNGWRKPSPPATAVEQPEAHMAAAEGDMKTLRRIAKDDNMALHYKDRNGWQPIHEAARAGHMDVVKLLLENGADKNARTLHGTGQTPLNLATTSLSEEHPVSMYLMSLGALNIDAEL